MSRLRSLLLLGLLSTLFACGKQQSDLDVYFKEVRARPIGEVEKLPDYPPYEPFDYVAMNMRSPFERPQNVVEIDIDFTPDAKPAVDRAKQPLEEFQIDALKLVGGLAKDENIWGLVLDPNGRVHRVSVGDYLGVNNGRITEVDESYIAFVELVPAGENRWRERPRSLRLEVLE